MRKWSLILGCALLIACLAGCGGEAKEPFDPETTARTLLDADGVFTESLERLDQAVVAGEYGLEDGAGTRLVCYYSPGGTAEEVAVVAFETESEAKAFVDTARVHLEDKVEENRDYRPAELPKLEKAVVERRGCTVLVLVCADYQAAQAALDG